MRTQTLILFKTSAFLLILSASIHAKKDCPNNLKKPQSKLICYYSKLEEVDGCYCSHVILPPTADVKGLERVKYELKGIKVFVSVWEFNEALINLLKSSKVDGLEINLRKLSSKNDIADFISTVKKKLNSDLDIVLSVPSRADWVAKYFDFKALSKNVDMFILQTGFLGASNNVTFHPSRLSGLWDMQNTDSVVDLVTGLGAPLSKLVVTAPVQAFQFTLQNEDYTAPGSPAVELKPLNREELCQKMNGGENWTLERDEDQAGPYIFSKKKWIAFEDEKSIDIKAKYSRIRGLAGIALKDLSFDYKNEKCGPSILESTFNGLSRQARAPRGAVLHSLEREMLENPGNSLSSVHLSPFRISRVIDTEGKIHVVRQDSRTEFQCSRQGYFVHPRSCNRFYRCVKFDQQTENFNVFEFDCPAGLAFDERVEVCVWPGSLPHGTPCSGSSEIAPVPKTRFACPSEPGYYVDPENCRWFFACLDHGKTPLTAYEFRCPYGLAFDGERLVCEWPWLVPKCANAGGSGSTEFDYYGGNGGYDLGYNLGYGANGGQGAHGTISPSHILQNYDGLGQLGTIKLGGLQAGTYEKPISKVYSTAGAVNGVGYQNNDGYIVGNGLGYQAVQSLQHAGLLKVNNGAALSHNTQGGFYTHDGSNVAYGQKTGGFVNLDQQQHLNQANGNHDTRYEADNHNHNLGANVQGGSVDASHNNGEQIYAQGALLGTNAAQSYAQGESTHSGGINLGANVQKYAQEGSGHLTEGQIYAYGGLPNTGQLNSAQSYSQSNSVHTTGINHVAHAQDYAQGGLINAGQTTGGQIYTQNGYAQGGFVQGGSENGGSINFEGNVQEGSIKAGYIKNGQIYAHGGSVTQNAGQLNTANSYAQIGGINLGANVQGYLQEGSVDAGRVTGGQIYANGYPNEGSVTSAYVSEGQIYNQNGYAQGGYVRGGFENAGSVNQGANVQGYVQQGPIHPGSVTGGQINIQKGYVQGGLENQFGYSGAEGAKSYQSITQTHGVGNQVDLKNTGTTFTTSNYDNNNHGSYQPNLNLNNLKGTTAYQVNTGLAGISTSAYGGEYGTGYNARENEIGQVNIVGGGYSAVGSHGSGVHVTNNGENHVNLAIPTVIVTSTTPVTTVTAIPTVTAVPFPQTHSTTYHKGGVIANIPELQHRVHSNGEFGLQNISNHASVVASTPSPFVTTTTAPISHAFVQTYSENGGYSYNKPNVDFASTIKPNVYVQEGYTYNKPSVAFEESPIKSFVPQIVVTSTIKPHIDTVKQGYIYEKPVVPFEETPQVYVSSTPRPEINVVKQGYVYEKPAIRFEETPVKLIVPQVFVSSTLRPEIQQGYVYNKPENSFTYSSNQHGATSYQTFNKVEQHGYSTPNVVFSSYSEVTPKPILSTEQKPQIFVSTTPLTPTVTPGYVYQKPASPQIISQFHISDTKSDSYNYQSNQNSGYYYEKPRVVFEEKPLQPVQPTISKFTVNEAKSNSFNHQLNQNTGGYYYERPRVVFEERPTYYNQNPAIPAQPIVELYKQPEMLSTYTYQQPAIYKTEYKAPVSSYTYQNVALNSVGYTQPKQPEISYIPSTTYRPQIVEQYQTTGFGYGQANAYHNSQQNYVSTEAKKCNWCNNLKARYNYPKPNVVRFEDTPQKVGYEYPKPQIKFEETPASYPNPKVSFKETPVIYTTPRPVVVERRPNQVGYNYPKPNIAFEETPVIYSTPKPVQPSVGYNYPKPTVVFQERPKPAVVSSFSYVAPQLKPSEPSYGYVASTSPQPVGYEYPVPQVPFVKNPITYENKVPIVEEPFVKKTSYVTGQEQGVVVENYQYQGPQIVHNYVQSTPKPTFVSTLRSIAAKKLEPVTPASVYVYNSRLTPTPQPEVRFVSTTARPIVYQQPQVSTSRPVSKFSFSSLDDQYQYNQYQQEVTYQSEQPQRVYLPVSSTELPEVSREYLPVQINTQAPSKEYLPAVEPVRQYVPLRQKVKVTTVVPPREYVKLTTVVPPREYLPAVEPTREYLPVRQRVKVITSTEAPYVNIKPGRVVESYVATEKVNSPSKAYLPAVEVTTPVREYLPVTPTKEYLPVGQRVRVSSTTRAPEITTLSREYLPQRQRVRLTSTVTPVITPVRTIIKQNDAHPFLSHKLGAQCTCVSPTINLRKNQKLLIVTTDEEDYSDNNDNYETNGNNDVENYSFEPEKVVEITPTPEVYIKSSTGANEYLPPRKYEVRKKIRVRPTSSPVTEVSEIFLKKDVTPSYRVLANEGAKQGTEKTLSKSFDRYGPGGVRSRSETLQGSIDCQRAGLFRHPTQCNKFYSCRWDCTKKKFTLHVFNCPVHLTFDDSMGACNWPSQGPACVDGTLITGE